MRTDIPAFYSRWFMNRIREGRVLVRNPYNYHQVSEYILDPKVVDLLVFCTKNPAPLLDYLDELSAFRMYWFVTITPYGRDFEENVPMKDDVMKSLMFLSEKLGKDRVALRYDPVIINEKYTEEYHLEVFSEMMETLDGFIDACVISYVDLYSKVRRNWPELKPVSLETKMRLTEKFALEAEKHSVVIRPCGEDDFLKAAQNTDCSGCMSREVYEKAVGSTLRFPALPSKREECSCILGNDIGAYDTCLHFCRYCYANSNRKKVLENHAAHDPESPMITGNITEGDRITRSEQKSWLDGQLMFDMDFI